MADRVLFIGFGNPVRGREERAVEVFNDCVGMYGRMQQEGRIDSMDVVLLPPNGGPLGGYMELFGSAEQVAAVRHSEDFRRLMADADLIVDDLSIIEGYANEGVAQEMAIYADAVAKVPQAVG